MTRGRAAVALTATIVLAPTLVLAQSAQDKADAEVLFNAGKAALGTGNFAEACPKLAESQKRDPAIGTALYLAECYERSGKIASAWAEFRQAEDMARARNDARASIAKSRADRLSPSKLVVALAPGADVPGLEVRRDGEVVAPAQYGLASPVDGGHHVIVATASGHKRFDWSGDVAAQEGSVVVTIPKLAEEAASAPSVTPTVPPPTPTVTATATVTAPPPTSSVVTPEHGGGLGGGKIAGLVIASVGLVTVGIGTTLGIVAKSNYDATSSGPDGCNPMTAGCPPGNGVSDRNAAKTLADVSTGVFIGGAVALVGGLVMFFALPKPKATSAAVSFTPFVASRGAGAALEGRF